MCNALGRAWSRSRLYVDVVCCQVRAVIDMCGFVATMQAAHSNASHVRSTFSGFAVSLIAVRLGPVCVGHGRAGVPFPRLHAFKPAVLLLLAYVDVCRYVAVLVLIPGPVPAPVVVVVVLLRCSYPCCWCCCFLCLLLLLLRLWFLFFFFLFLPYCCSCSCYSCSPCCSCSCPGCCRLGRDPVGLRMLRDVGAIHSQ